MNNAPTCEDLAILRRSSFAGWLPRYPAAAFPAQPNPDTQQYYVIRPRVDRQVNESLLSIISLLISLFF